MYPNLKSMKRPPPTTPRTPAPSRPKLVNTNNSSTESLQVFCRLRPTEDESCVQVLNDTTIRLTLPESSINFRPGVCREYQYSFKKIFTEIHNQKDVFKTVARPLVENLIRGKNGLLFTYGVTGSGKTHTMTGNENNVGILPRCLDVLFNTISDYQAMKYVFKPDRMNGFEVQSENDASKEREDMLRGTFAKSGKSKKTQSNDNLTDIRSKDESKLSFLEEDNAYSVFVTYIEIYNNTVFDLLEKLHESDVVKLQSKIIREDGAHNMYVHGVTEMEVKSADEACEIFRKGQKRRRMEQTNLNKESSRSHSIFTIRLVQAPLDISGENVLQDKKAISISQLSLVDLAGSERTNRTNNCGQRLREAGNINNSLMTLRNCLEILRENQQTGSEKIIPHRESRLTHLFKNFFDGEGDIRMIVCVNPRIADYDETIQVMRFAEVSQEIQVKPTPAKLDTPAIGLTPGRRRAHQLFVQKKQTLEELREREPLAYVPNDAEAIYSLEQFPSTENYDPFDPDSNKRLCKFLEDRIIKKKTLMADIESRCDKFRADLLIQEENFLKLQQDYDAVNARRECDLMKTRALEEKLLSLDSNSSSMKRRCEQYEDEIKRLKRDLERKNVTIQQFSVEKDREKRTHQKYIAKVELLAKEKENSAKEKHQIELQLKDKEKQLRRVKKALLPHEENSVKVKMARFDDFDTETETVISAQTTVDLPYQETTPILPPKSFTSPTRSVPVSNTRFGRTHCDAKDEWLDHRSAVGVPLNTVMQPIMKRRRSFSNVTSPKELTKTSKYCLMTQNQDEDGVLETQLYKGDVVPTSGGGAQIILNDVETLRQTSPISSPVTSPVTSPRKILMDEKSNKTITSPSKSYHNHVNAAIAAYNSHTTRPDVSGRCAVSVEGRSLRKK